MSDNRRKNLTRDAYGRSTTSRRSGGPVRKRAAGGRAYTTNRTNMPRRRRNPVRRRPVPPSLGLGGSGYGALLNAAVNECPFLNTVDYGGWNSYGSILNTLNRCPQGPAVNALQNAITTDPNPFGWAEACCFAVSVIDAVISLFGGTNCCDVANTNAGAGQDQGGGGGNQGGGNQGGGNQGGQGSDIALKENINLIGESPSGINIYEFEYKDKKYGEGKYTGVMAQEVPEASFRNDDGYLWVDYSKIDVNFEKKEESS